MCVWCYPAPCGCTPVLFQGGYMKIRTLSLRLLLAEATTPCFVLFCFNKDIKVNRMPCSTKISQPHVAAAVCSTSNTEVCSPGNLASGLSTELYCGPMKQPLALDTVTDREREIFSQKFEPGSLQDFLIKYGRCLWFPSPLPRSV